MGLEQNRRFGSGMPKRQEPDGDNSPVLYELSGYKVHEYSLNMALHLKDPESACSSGLGRDAALSNWEGQAGQGLWHGGEAAPAGGCGSRPAGHQAEGCARCAHTCLRAFYILVASLLLRQFPVCTWCYASKTKQELMQDWHHAHQVP